MKISEAIEHLKEIQEKLGDIEIEAMVHSDAFGGDKHNFMMPLYLL